ncbi:UDP-glucose--hexose-1-phosphate uridylyltransferase [Neobacillus terrae]|uniref:UDP-glucose--hexose-1-phosphate uridylyltransferase n=1 Tax=Neobacillus terrae TaxID=3034837 RepID=UPI00140B8510|nr:UDP-glucose--hexose-1-phosphate uridylyltransferase [Neobacillus terrae]NHM31883.1 UDP-glucose--hexose-1-phosphate uridylyltransferase [Neobacillus terrae]
MTDIYQYIQDLIEYGVRKKLIEADDVLYTRNRILALLGLDDWEDTGSPETLLEISDILGGILDWAAENGHLVSNTTTERDIFDTEIMNCMMPRPSEVVREFKQNYKESPETATNQYYDLSIASNYIREDRVDKNKQWKSPTPYGEIDITINLSKPEKDPKEIALLKNAPAASYPACALCRENEGFKGNLRNAARATHRVIPITLNNEDWCLQYSPYVYYNEHCIVFREQHLPMKISRETFTRLLEFTEKFPHYFVGSNADLPIVGGSILSHDHFQGGRYEFAIERANMEETITLPAYPSVTIGIVNWPMSVLRVRGDKKEVEEVTEFIWKQWQGYSDPNTEVFAFSEDVPHNTVTPIARRRGQEFEMDVVLRNNRTSYEHPFGIFHPHQEVHHVKKENIGLIEVMGLAVLPGRLEGELEKLSQYLIEKTPKENWDESILKHWDWSREILKQYSAINHENIKQIIETEVGRKFQTVLEHAGVFKRTEDGKQAFLHFLKHLEQNV